MNLKDIITDWKVQYGLRKEAKSGATYYVIPIKERQDLLAVLVDILRENPEFQTREAFDKSVCRQIAEGCSWPEGPDRKKTARIMGAVIGNDLPIVLSNAFRGDQDVASAEIVKGEPVTQEGPAPVIPAVVSETPPSEPLPSPRDEEELDTDLDEFALKLARNPLKPVADLAAYKTDERATHILRAMGIEIETEEFSDE